jgi:hypothetical protein
MLSLPASPRVGLKVEPRYRYLYFCSTGCEGLHELFVLTYLLALYFSESAIPQASSVCNIVIKNGNAVIKDKNTGFAPSTAYGNALSIFSTVAVAIDIIINGTYEDSYLSPSFLL